MQSTAITTMLLTSIIVLFSQASGLTISQQGAVDRQCVQLNCASELTSCQQDRGGSDDAGPRRHCMTVLNCVTQSQVSLVSTTRFLDISHCVAGMSAAQSPAESSLYGCINKFSCMGGQASSFFQLSAKEADADSEASFTPPLLTDVVPPMPEYFEHVASFQLPESLAQEIDDEPAWKKVHRQTEEKLAAAHKQLVDANEQIKKNVQAQKNSLAEIEKIKEAQIAKTEAAKKQALHDLQVIIPSFIQTSDLESKVNALVEKAQAKLKTASHGFEQLFHHSSLMQGLTDSDARDPAGSLASQADLDRQADDASLTSFVQVEQFNPAKIQERLDQALAQGKVAAAKGEEEIAKLSAKMNEQLDQLKSMSMLEKQTVDANQAKVHNLDKLRTLLADQATVRH